MEDLEELLPDFADSDDEVMVEEPGREGLLRFLPRSGHTPNIDGLREKRLPPFGIKAPGQARPLSATEANEFEEYLIESMPDILGAVDWVITKTNRQHRDCYIWRDMPEDEQAVIVRAIIERGERSVQVAETVRAAVYVIRQWEVGIITLPRMLETLDFYAESGGFYLPIPSGVIRALNQWLGGMFRRPQRRGGL